MSSPDPVADPRLAAAIARAERRRAKLERLSDIGMALAEDIGERNVGAPYHPEPRHDPGRAFAAVSRAVRLTLVLEARIDAEILAMSNGEAVTVVQTPPRAMRHTTCEPVDEEPSDSETATDPRERTYESLIDREDNDALLSRSYSECVEAIRADLGLGPDQSNSSDEYGLQSEITPESHSLPRSGEGGLAASDREPGGGQARRSESGRTSHDDNLQHLGLPPPAPGRRRESPSSLLGREDEVSTWTG